MSAYHNRTPQLYRKTNYTIFEKINEREILWVWGKGWEI